MIKLYTKLREIIFLWTFTNRDKIKLFLETTALIFQLCIDGFAFFLLFFILANLHNLTNKSLMYFAIIITIDLIIKNWNFFGDRVKEIDKNSKLLIR